MITNVESEIVTAQWIVDTYSSRNWVERLEPHLVFYREAKGCLGLKEYQVREKKSLKRHFILVFCAYTFILWHKLTGSLRRRWANKPLNTFPEAKRGISYRYILPFCPKGYRFAYQMAQSKLTYLQLIEFSANKNRL